MVKFLINEFLEVKVSLLIVDWILDECNLLDNWIFFFWCCFLVFVIIWKFVFGIFFFDNSCFKKKKIKILEELIR